ncbi:MAG: hypothetical protein ACP5JU_02425 [Minisyncoccia bacterium]
MKWDYLAGNRFLIRYSYAEKDLDVWYAVVKDLTTSQQGVGCARGANPDKAIKKAWRDLEKKIGPIPKKLKKKEPYYRYTVSCTLEGCYVKDEVTGKSGCGEDLEDAWEDLSKALGREIPQSEREARSETVFFI